MFAGALVQDVSAIVFDSTVFGLTINKTVNAAIKARRLKMRNTLAYLFVRDGKLYYFARYEALIFIQVPCTICRLYVIM